MTRAAACVCLLIVSGSVAAQTKKGESRPAEQVADKRTAEQKEADKAAGWACLGFSGAALFIAAGIALLSYFLPSFVAFVRGHTQIAAILFVNLLLGWTLLGWVAALAWAFIDQKPQYRRRY